MAICKATTKKGKRCTRKIPPGNRSYCKQHSKALKRKPKKGKKMTKISKERKAKKAWAAKRKAKKLTISQQKKAWMKQLAKLQKMKASIMQQEEEAEVEQQGCGDPECSGCTPPKEILGFAQNLDSKIIEMCETTDKPLWEIAKLAGVDESHVMRLCQTIGLERGSDKIGGPGTWKPLFRGYYPQRPLHHPPRRHRYRRYRRT